MPMQPRGSNGMKPTAQSTGTTRHTGFKEEIMGNVRDRLERAYVENLYLNAASKNAKTPEQNEKERLAKLRTAADQIKQQEVGLLLAQSEMTPDEQDVIRRRIQAENPNALANADVWSAQLLKIRTEG